MDPIVISLNGYCAQTNINGPLVLGTSDSYGIEQLQINPGPEWEGLTITATFVTPNSTTRMVVPASGLLDVPQEATKNPLTVGMPGAIVFAGVARGVQRISTNVYYLVRDHKPIDGTAPAPTPSEWQQLVAEYQTRLDKAVPPNGTPGYVLGATDNGNAWVPQTGGGGADGGYYTPAIEQTEPGTADFSWTASKADMPAVPGMRLTLPPGPQGPAYELTPEDKQSIVQDVLAALPNAEGVGF